MRLREGRARLRRLPRLQGREGSGRRAPGRLPQRHRRLFRQCRRRDLRRGVPQSRLLRPRGAVRLDLAVQRLVDGDGPAAARHLRRQARQHARLHRQRLRQSLAAGAAPDGRMGEERQDQIPRGRRAGHRQGAERLHRHAARRELRQAAGQNGMSYDAPFAGLKVVDLSQGIAGPYCAILLAQHGAEVIKVEGIGEGDWARTLGTRYGTHSAFSIVGNLGKKSIAVDLKSEAGKQVVWRLLKGADVFLEGFRPGVIKRLGFDYDSIAAREPRLLYVSISGFGQTGPLSARPAMDPLLQAYTGLMNENRGEDGIPHRVPVIVVDMSTALYAFQALSAALYARRDQPRGRYIHVSLMQAAAPLQSIRLMAGHLDGGTIRASR